MANEITRSNAQLVSIRQMLESRKEQLAQLMPKHLTPDRLIKVALNCIAKTPRLQQCSGSSLLQCVISAAELGLDPGGALGHAYLVPFNDKKRGMTCTLIIGYKGMVDLARRSGQLAQIEAHVVHEGDDFQVEFGLSPVMRHKPKLDGEPGRPLLAYMLARMKDGSVHCEVMTWAEIQRVRRRSRSADDGPWVTDEEEMAKKTVIRRGMKLMPLSVEVARAFEMEEDDSPAIDITPLPEEETAPADPSIRTGLLENPVLPEPTIREEVAASLSGNEKAKAAIAAKRKMLIEDVPAGAEEAQP